MPMNKTGATCVAALAAILCTRAAFGGDAVVHAGTLIDGLGGAPRHDVSILIHDDKITSVENGFRNPAGAEVIDLSKATVLPGFIDCHVYILGIAAEPHESIPSTR